MPSSKECSAPNCPNLGDQTCSGCADASYCGRECQENDWKFHKKTCYSSQKCNCFLLRAKGPEDVSPTNVMAHVEMFHLVNYGSEPAEHRELGSRLGSAWAQVQKLGKFYNQAGGDTWYYHIYGPNQTRARLLGLPKNEIASTCIAQTGNYQRGPVYGDVAIVRSAPGQYSNTFPETFSRLAVVKDIKFNMEHDPATILQEREHSRAMKE